MPDLNDLHEHYLRAFAGESGRMVLADIERRAFVRETSFHADPQRAAFNEGRRSLALHIRRMLDPAGIPAEAGDRAPAGQ